MMPARTEQACVPGVVTDRWWHENQAMTGLLSNGGSRRDLA
jgi:hypothetical protein